MRENEELKERLYRLGLEKPATENTLASGREQLKIDFCYSRNGLNAETKRFRKINEEWSNVAVSWDDMFAAIAPDMLKNPRYSDPSNSLSAIIEQKSHEHLQRKHIGQKFDNFRISSRSYDTILLQFRAIKLLTVDGEGQWKLTPYGDNYMTKLLAVPKGKKK